MRLRVLTSLVLLAVLAVVYVFLDTLLLNAVIWIISVLGLIELLGAVGILKHRDLTALAMVQAFVIPFVRAGYIRFYAMPIIFLLILCHFVILVRHFGSMGIGKCATAFLFSTIIPIFFSCAVYIRDEHGTAKGGFYLIIALGAAWLSDTGAYFTGTFLGKHKLAPRVSPKKTVEGLVGGVAVCTGLLLLIGVIYKLIFEKNGVSADVNFGLLALLSPVFSLIGVLGDLSASAIKREYSIKDFGNLMPGHGGILDRFDSVLFTLPAVYVTVRHVQLLTFL